MDSSKQPEWQTEHTICSCDVDPHQTARLPAFCRFMQEAVYGHAVSIASAEAGLHHYVHTISADDKELFRARSSWKEDGVES